jgi:hypothetical protein
VIGLRNAAERRSNAILGERPVTPLQTGIRVATAPFELASAPFRSNPSSIINRSLHPIRGSADSLIQDLYRQAPEATPLPIPSGPYPRLGANRMLPAPSHQMQTSPDTSFVRGMPLDASQKAATMRLALPPGSAPFTQGTSVPDVLGRPDLRTGYRAGLIESPKPGQPPINVLPEGPPSARLPSFEPSSIGNPRPLGSAGSGALREQVIQKLIDRLAGKTPGATQ